MALRTDGAAPGGSAAAGAASCWRRYRRQYSDLLITQTHLSLSKQRATETSSPPSPGNMCPCGLMPIPDINQLSRVQTSLWMYFFSPRLRIPVFDAEVLDMCFR